MNLEHKLIPPLVKALFRVTNDAPSNVAFDPIRKTPVALLSDMLTELSITSKSPVFA